VTVPWRFYWRKGYYLYSSIGFLSWDDCPNYDVYKCKLLLFL